jgi:phosphatidylserine decarboxylase
MNHPSEFSHSPAGDREAPPAQISLADRLGNLPQYLLPQRLLTRWVHHLTRMRTPWVKNGLIRIVIAIFKIDLSDAEPSDPRAYKTFNEFFTRPLRPGARPVCAEKNSICSPVDGTVSQLGKIADDNIFQAKGRGFSLGELLGGDADQAGSFRNGRFATLYLSPRDYHRIHMPISGRLRAMTHIPGRLFSVSPLTTRVVPRLFARNERVVTLFDTAVGPMALVLVGAVNVASIETVWAGAITPPLGVRVRTWGYDLTGPDSVALDRGAEMGRFNMGSTVILLFADGALEWNETLGADSPIRMGAAIGRIGPR